MNAIQAAGDQVYPSDRKKGCARAIRDYFMVTLLTGSWSMGKSASITRKTWLWTARQMGLHMSFVPTTDQECKVLSSIINAVSGVVLYEKLAWSLKDEEMISCCLSAIREVNLNFRSENHSHGFPTPPPLLLHPPRFPLDLGVLISAIARPPRLAGRGARE